jgi:hypothetical protein
MSVNCAVEILVPRGPAATMGSTSFVPEMTGHDERGLEETWQTDGE